MKAIILTYAPIQNFERDLLIQTDIFKLALNGHAKELKPNTRIITDYVLTNILKTCSEKVISVREIMRCESDRVEYPKIEFKGSTMIAGIDYLISKNFDEILIIGDNKVHSLAFREEINKEIDKISSKYKIYQYSEGNFNLEVRSIKEFIENK